MGTNTLSGPRRDDPAIIRERTSTGTSSGHPRRYTVVFKARSMIFVNASTIESPVTTPYSTAPNAAAAIVPMAYSAVLMPSSSTAARTVRSWS